jgi:flagellar biosynthesis protein FlhF
MMKFIASTLDAAKAKAHRALGDKAVIISVRNLPSGDVEVQASDKPQPAAPIERAPEPVFGAAARQAIEESRVRQPTGARLNETIEQRFAEDALARLTGQLTGGGKASGPQLDMSDKLTAKFAEALRPHGLGEPLIASLIEGARKARLNDDLHRLETAFVETFAFAPLGFSPARPIMLVGPTGAGKTSCAAKLAASAIASGSQAVILTADGGRAGAVEQIETYSHSLGVDYFIVDTPQDVLNALRARKPTGAVILDTPGVSPFDVGDLAALKSFLEASNGEALLVLPASGDAEEFKEWALAFADFGVRRAIITKFDATKRVGAALAAAHAGGMALAHFSESPFISEGLMPASAEFLARRLLASRPGRLG